MKAVEQSFSRNGVRVFRLNTPAVMEALRAAALRLLEARADVLEVRLFGSLARRQGVPGSDADVLVVVSDSPLPFRERLPVYARFFERAGIACDVFVYTEAELDAAAPSALGRRARAEGVMLAARPSPHIAP